MVLIVIAPFGMPCGYFGRSGDLWTSACQFSMWLLSNQKAPFSISRFFPGGVSHTFGWWQTVQSVKIPPARPVMGWWGGWVVLSEHQALVGMGRGW